ncbi:MAG TPA: tetratricopeptide repeat protein, partial [Lentisphaeria bacterium]|nr:tetratricopeptide repeat protein [Lentisphaeria bacterium]
AGNTKRSQIEDVGQNQAERVSASPVPSPAADQRLRIMRVCIKGDGLLERFEPDFYDTLRAVHAAGHASQVDLQRHFLAKFFERLLFLAPPATNTPDGASIANIVNRLVAAWTQRSLNPKDDSLSPIYDDLLELSTFHGGLGANPRLIISTLSSVLPLMLSAARSVGYDLSNSEMKDFISLLRLSLGLYCYLDRHPDYIMGLEAADSMRIADALFAFASPENFDFVRKETASLRHKLAKANYQEEKNLPFNAIEATAPSYSERRSPLGQRSSEKLLACQVVFGIKEDIADQQRLFVRNDKEIRSLCNELCRVWTYSRRHLLSDTPADWDLIRVDRAWDVLNSGNPERAIIMFDASIAVLVLDMNATPERKLALAHALRGRGCAYLELGRVNDAISAYNEVVRRFGKAPEPALCEEVATALINKGNAYEEAQCPDEVVKAYDEVVSRFRDSPEPALRELVAMALISKGIFQTKANSPDEAVKAFGKVEHLFGDAQEEALRKWVATALVCKGVNHGKANSPDKAVKAFERVDHLFGEAPEAALREWVATALVCKGVIHEKANSPDDAIAAYDEVVRRFGDASEPALRKLVLRAHRNAIEVLEEQGGKEEAEERLRKIRELFGSETSTDGDFELGGA